MTSLRFGLFLVLALATAACATSAPPPDLHDEILTCSSASGCGTWMPAPAPEEICSVPASCDPMSWRPYF